MTEARRQEILGHLRGLPAARVPRHHHNGVAPHQLHDPVSVLEDGQVLLLPPQLGQFPKALPLAEVQEVEEGQSAVGDLPGPRGRRPRGGRAPPVARDVNN